MRRNGASYAIHAENNRGIMYGILELASQLEKGKALDSLQEKAVRAHFPFRAIKFNLPWYSYRSGENLALHTETCRDLEFWRAFLDMMVENKFNTLSLWNMHPYIYMVRPKNFPEASPFTDEEMAEWQSLLAGAVQDGQAARHQYLRGQLEHLRVGRIRPTLRRSRTGRRVLSSLATVRRRPSSSSTRANW